MTFEMLLAELAAQSPTGFSLVAALAATLSGIAVQVVLGGYR